MNAPLHFHTSRNPTPAEIECLNPATGERIGSVHASSPDEVKAIVERARVAQKKWAQSTFTQRRVVLQNIIDLMLDNIDALCDAVVQDSGKTYENAILGEIMSVYNKIKWVIKNGEKHLQPEKVPSGLLMHNAGRIEYRPLGVVACIVPWNYPFQNVFDSIAAPLMAGNSVLVKVSETVAQSTQLLQKIIDEALTKEGFSPDTIQIINGYGHTGAALVRSGVLTILFIGSVGNVVASLKAARSI